MKVLVTGNQGMIGSVIEATLKTEGFEVIGFDLANGDDIRNLDSLRDAASGCDFIDVRDLANATICALECPNPGHVALLVCADDISSAQRTSRELASSLLPGVSWRGGLEFDRAPYKALIDTTQAQQILGWIPRYHWRA